MSNELLNKIFEKLVILESNMATKQDIAAINERLDRLEATQANGVISILHTINSKVSAANERLDYQRGKLSVLEEEIHLVKHKQ